LHGLGSLAVMDWSLTILLVWATASAFMNVLLMRELYYQKKQSDEEISNLLKEIEHLKLTLFEEERMRAPLPVSRLG
jgi:hypothetical protein